MLINRLQDRKKVYIHQRKSLKNIIVDKQSFNSEIK